MTEPQGVFIERFVTEPHSSGPRVTVKDLIDVAGSVTTAGCRALAERQAPAEKDATCITRLRQGGAQLVGKVNLHELAYGVSGINPWYGTPENPVDPGRVPGGSSSGSAVAVATGEADIALGTDTGGSVRIPAACCGVVGLKTTFGRIPCDGVWPLGRSFDTVGPLARDVAGVVRAMSLLEPGFAPAKEAPTRVALIDLGPEVPIDPVIAEAVERALHDAELSVERVPVDRWREAWRAQQLLLHIEAVEADGWLLEESGGVGIGEATLERLRRPLPGESERDEALAERGRFQRRLGRLLEDFGMLALPTIDRRPPFPEEGVVAFNVLTAPVNFAGLPALSLPVPALGRPPTGLQLIGGGGDEELLVSAAGRIERAISGPFG